MTARQVRAHYTQEFKMEAVRQVRGGQAIAVVAKVLGIPKASTWFDIPQRQGQSILQRGLTGRVERMGHALIDEQKGKLLGQCANGKLLGSAENGQCAWSFITCHATWRIVCFGYRILNRPPVPHPT